MGIRKVAYVFRRPRFPLICDLDIELIAASSPARLQRRLDPFGLPPGKCFRLVDATGEGWALHTEWMTVSPLTIKRRWTKSEIIRLFNLSANARRTGQTYPEVSLSSKSVQKVVADIAALVDEGNRTSRSIRRRRR